MPYHQSTKKRLRTNAKAAARNKHYSSKMKTAIKNVENASEKNEATEAFKEATSVLDKLAGKGVIHKNKAANKKSQLAKRVNSIA